MTKYSGSGWHKQSVRHSNARKYGRAGGRYSVVELPIYQIKGKQYYRDVRLGEYRNVKDPSDKLDINIPNSMLEKPTMPHPSDVKKKFISDFEDMKDNAELRALSNTSLQRPLTDKEYKRFMELGRKAGIFLESPTKKHYGEPEEAPAETYKGITISKHQRVRERDGKTIYSIYYNFKRSKFPKGEAFLSEKDRDERIKELKETQDYIDEEKQKTKSAQNFTRANVPFKAGDTFETSWGYDQTNYDFIVIKSISPTGKTATCQRARLSQNKPEGQLMLQKPSKEGYGDTFNMKIKRHTDGGFYLVGTYADSQGHYDGHWRRDTFNQTSPEQEYAETSPEFGH